MKAKQVITIRTIINESYLNVKMNIEGDDVWYVLLQDYNYDLIYSVLLEYIKNGKVFAPSIADLIKMYDIKRESFVHPLVSFMLDKGYFDDTAPCNQEIKIFNRNNRVRKTTMYIIDNKVPHWLRDDLNKYHKMMQKEELMYKDKKQIESGGFDESNKYV